MNDHPYNRERMEKQSNRSHIWTGLFLLLVGGALILRMNNPEIPSWIVSWQMLLIALGVFLGLKHRFHGPAWFVLILIGGFFLYADLNPEVEARKYILPVVLITIGMFIIFRPSAWKNRRRCYPRKPDGPGGEETPLQAGESITDDYVDTTAIFGGAKKNIISKNFRGGDLVNIFGGTELDLTRADFSGLAEIELTTIFGGTKLIVPSNWNVRSEAVTLFGGLEDKRNMSNAAEDPAKTLVLKGTVIFGGIELKSY
jgi:predicted membrane protein